VVFTASPLYWVFRNYENSEDSTPKWTFIVGGVLSIVGIIGEWISDNQIETYRKNKAKLRKIETEKSVQLSLEDPENLKKNDEKLIVESPDSKEGNLKDKLENNDQFTNSGKKENSNEKENSDKKEDDFSNIFHEGLWKKSRHPNLFFELLVWIGFAISGVTEWEISWIAFLGPIFLWAVMWWVTIPITEEYMAKSRSNWPKWLKKSNKLWIF